MWLDPRRSAGALWVAWVLAGAAGGGLATLISLAGMGAMLDGNAGELAVLGYETAFAVIAALFQFFVIQYVAGGRRAAVLWLPATVLALNLYLWLNAAWLTRINDLASFLPKIVPGLDLNATMNVIFGAGDALYGLVFGVVQGLVLALMTRRKAALWLWVAGGLLGVLASAYVPRLVPLQPSGPGPELVASSAILAGSYALATGLALVLILRPRRLASPPMLVNAVPSLEGQG